MISRCSSPRKPQRNPKPSAALVSISNEKLASLRRSLPMAARRSSNRAASTGKRPQNTTGIEGRKPGSAAAGVGHLLDRGGEHADLARAELVDQRQLGLEHAGAVDLIVRIGAHHAD